MKHFFFIQNIIKIKNIIYLNYLKMYTTKTIENIGKAELAASVGIDASWH